MEFEDWDARRREILRVVPEAEIPGQLSIVKVLEEMEAELRDADDEQRGDA
jgi:hypothetical protein